MAREVEMKIFNFSKANLEYRIQIERWAKNLGAEEIVIHSDGSVTATCEYGSICNNYKPSAYELIRR